MTQPPVHQDPNKGLEKSADRSTEKAKNKTGASIGPECYEVLDSPRFQGLYRAMAAVTLPVQGLSSHAKGSLADLDHLYPRELGHALYERASLQTKLRNLLESPQEEIDLPYKARLEGEIQKIERRLWLHNRRTREAHLALAETLGRGWADFLTTLARVINNLERLKANLAPAQSWANKEVKLDLNLLRSLVDSTLTHLLDLLKNLGQPLDEIYQKTHSVYELAQSVARADSPTGTPGPEDTGLAGTGIAGPGLASFGPEALPPEGEGRAAPLTSSFDPSDSAPKAPSP
ncbi:MAG: hypothetical protein LBF38_11185, partial [Deltaproteobacteria bacterium]|nr:hypothetical protein [Deltaproteobacteria bacterium]